MEKNLIIDSSSSDILIALTEDKQLVELHKDFKDNNYTVGDIYFGRVVKIIRGLNAVFVDVGYEKDAFLHYFDLGLQINSYSKYIRELLSGKCASDISSFEPENDIPKSGKIGSILHVGDKILVRIAKEPISAKGPKVTAELSFPGRYLVLIPFSNKISVSQKIKEHDEKIRLINIAESLRPKNFGIIIRTVAESKNISELSADINELVNKWNTLVSMLPNVNLPVKVYSELGKSFTILRDLLNESFSNIYVDNPVMATEIRCFIENIAPDKLEIVKLHKGKSNIFEHHGISKQIKNAFGKKIFLKSGSYIIIEHTEAFHTIDVNSGYKKYNGKDHDSDALEINLEAAEEITKQLRLRDIGGIIVIDFIDMAYSTNKRKLYEKMKTLMKNDRAKHSILPPSKYGLVQITRQRVRPETSIDVSEQCPLCDGSGKIKHHTLFIDDMKNQIQYFINEKKEKKITLAVSQFIYSYLTKGLPSIIMRWRWKNKKWIKLIKSKSYNMLEYHFFNPAGEEIHQ